VSNDSPRKDSNLGVELFALYLLLKIQWEWDASAKERKRLYAGTLFGEEDSTTEMAAHRNG